jgi:hypothetical protein
MYSHLHTPCVPYRIEGRTPSRPRSACRSNYPPTNHSDGAKAPTQPLHHPRQQDSIRRQCAQRAYTHTHARARAPLSIHWSYTAIEPVSSVTQSITRFQLTKSILRRLRMCACIWSVDSSMSVYWMHATYGKVFFPFSFVRVAALHLELALVS